MINRLNHHYRILICAFVFAMTAVLSFLITKNLDTSSAASLANWDAGDIISDGVMSNYTSMSESQIQNFLKSKNACNDTRLYLVGNKTSSLDMSGTMNWHVENGHFVCMADESFDGESAAHIIWQASQDYKINPQVLIVLLQKEQGLVTDTLPRSGQYRAATGYGCPDTAPCDSEYYGFKNQVRKAASMFRSVLNGGWTNYPVGDNYIQYNPNAACGGSIVNVKNRATSSLYRYTPYQPNAGALAAGYGTCNCGAYGNRNFYLYFTDWFGSTHQATGAGYVYERYEKIGGEKSALGKSVGAINCDIGRTGACVQAYEKGIIVYTPETGAWENYGDIRSRLIAVGGVNKLGYPTSSVNCNIGHDGACVQAFEKNAVIISSKYGTYESHGRLRTRHAQLGSIDGVLGLPTSGVSQSGNYFTQKFENGIIVANDATGTWGVYGKIFERYSQLGGLNSKLGLPVSAVNYNIGRKNACVQAFEKGIIVYSPETGAWENYGDIRARFLALGGVDKFGYPVSAVNCNIGRTGACAQAYEGDKVIIYSPQTGAWENYGAIRKRLTALGGVDKFGYPISPMNCNIGRKDACVQAYEGNKVIIYSPQTGAWENYGNIRTKFIETGSISGSLGYPISAQTSTYQRYENGTISIVNGVATVKN